MRGPSQDPPPSSNMNLVIAVVVVIISVIGAASNLCGPPCLSEACPLAPAYCQSLWKLQQLFQQPVPNISPTNDEQPNDEQPPPQKPRKRNPLARLFRRRRSKLKKQASTTISQYPNAFSPLDRSPLSRTEKDLVAKMARRAQDTIPSLDTRAAAVPWGGPGTGSGNHWWSDNGSSLLPRYLKIMDWPQDLMTKFPFKLCATAAGCNAEFAIAHTLEWREKYKPWCMSPSGIKENTKGYVYTRGYSPSLTGDDSGHSLMWLRIPIHRADDPVQWVRAIMNALERAVADSLHRTNGKVGRFNCVVDGNGFTLGMMFGMGPVKRMVVMLQDHFSDRLGVVLLTNFSKPAQVMLSFVKPLLTKDVREKLIVLPDDSETRHAMLDALVGPEFLPYYLGGNDEWRFSTKEYYSSTKHHCTDAESTEYLETMPYHAN